MGPIDEEIKLGHRQIVNYVLISEPRPKLREEREQLQQARAHHDAILGCVKGALQHSKGERVIYKGRQWPQDVYLGPLVPGVPRRASTRLRRLPIHRRTATATILRLRSTILRLRCPILRLRCPVLRRRGTVLLLSASVVLLRGRRAVLSGRPAGLAGLRGIASRGISHLHVLPLYRLPYGGMATCRRRSAQCPKES